MNGVFLGKRVPMFVAALGVSSMALASSAAKASESASQGDGSIGTLVILGVLGGLGYVFYKSDLLPSGPSAPKDYDSH